MCMFSKSNCHKCDYVLAGFPIDRSIEDMHSIFSMLSNDGEMSVTKRQGDYSTRAGVTSEPITHRELTTPSLSRTPGFVAAPGSLISFTISQQVIKPGDLEIKQIPDTKSYRKPKKMCRIFWQQRWVLG